MSNEPPPGAPGRGITGGLICLCQPNKTYCPHRKGLCPWWDREPIDPTWHRVEPEK